MTVDVDKLISNLRKKYALEEYPVPESQDEIDYFNLVNWADSSELEVEEEGDEDG